MNVASSVPEKNKGSKKQNNPTRLRLVDENGKPQRGYTPTPRAGMRMPSPFTHRELAPVETVDISAADLEACAMMWLRTSERADTPKSFKDKKNKTEQFLWFIQTKGYPLIGTYEIEEFLKHVKDGHREPGGRWGNPKNRSEMRPVTVRGYYNSVRALFNYIVKRGFLGQSPVAVIAPTKVPRDRIYLFTEDEVRRLLEASLSSWHPRRNYAICYLLYDTGLRVGELVALDRRHLDTRNQRLTVLGKGDKTRILRVGDTAYKAVWDYLREDPPGQADPLFRNSRGKYKDGRLTEHAIGDMVGKLGKQCGIDGTRCSPHTFRHTFATHFLKRSNDLYALRDLLGHTTLEMSLKYAHLANVDIEAQHGKYSPGDWLAGVIK